MPEGSHSAIGLEVGKKGARDEQQREDVLGRRWSGKSGTDARLRQIEKRVEAGSGACMTVRLGMERSCGRR